MLGFWLLFFLYPLNGTHHYVFSVIPMAAQTSAIAASALLGVAVIIVVTNLFLSLRGAGIVPRDPGLRFVATGTLFYLIVSVQGAAAGADGGEPDRALHRLGGRSLTPGDARVRDLRGRGRARARVAAHPVGAVQRARDRWPRTGC